MVLVHNFMEGITEKKPQSPSAEIPDIHILSIFTAALNCFRLRAKNKVIPQDDTPCYHWCRLVQMFTTFLDISHLAIPKGGGGGGVS